MGNNIKKNIKNRIKKEGLKVCKFINNVNLYCRWKCGDQAVGGEHIVNNINYHDEENQKRVLIVYLDLIKTDSELCEEGAVHTNRLELFQIIRYFIKCDYIIDVCANYDLDAVENIRKHKYDIVFGLGEVFRRVAAETDAFRILYLTENPYDISYMREKERVDYFYERTGKRVDLQRTGSFFKKDDEKLADAIICFGDDKFLSDLSVPVRRILPSMIFNENFRDYSKRKNNNFLILGTDGFIHKGVDLLIEVFNKHPEWNLYMCGHCIEEKVKEHGYVLNSNIHNCGYIDIKSDIFVELAEKCMFIVLPSCSEAASTAVMTGMCHGMIPIIMKDNGMDELTQYCEFFEDYRIESIEKKIHEIIEEPIELLVDKGKMIREYAKETYSLEKFTKDFEKVFDEIVKEI
ncbi:MAG: glycosyltransferase [Lachnospiraceae bacterium]|nr:glycosyltransferase [Lachnospiraceae bacterium]